MKKILAIILAVFMLASCCTALAEEATLGIVTTQYGQMQGVAGETYENVTVFKGVPYAAPPVGDLRWAAPQDPEAWEGVRVCDEHGDAAVQPSYVATVCDYNNEAYEWRHFYPDGAPSNSEDCLYLDIYTSATTGDEKMPVIVWFHGGGMNHGYGFEIEFNGEALADKGAIVVNVTHRLNVFGLLSLPQLSAETEYGGSGNYLVMDCAKAIEWVYENIEAFGGDPSRITVGGQSGGSSKTTASLVSPLTDGMIYGTYNMSSLSPYGSYRTLEANEEAGLKFIEALGFDETTPIEEIRAVPAEEIIAAYDTAGFSGSTCIDGYALTMNPSDYYLTPGNLNGLNMMFGSVYGENGTFDAVSSEDLMAKIRETYGDELVDKYDIENSIELTEYNYVLLNRLLKVKAANAGNRMFAALAQSQNEDFNIFGFSFARITPGSEIGWHSGELWYMFGSLRDNGLQRDWQVWDYMTAENGTAYWANFAATGDPNGYGLAEWPEMTVENGLAYAYIDYMTTYNGEIDNFDLMVMEYTAARNNIDFDAILELL